MTGDEWSTTTWDYLPVAAVSPLTGLPGRVYRPSLPSHGLSSTVPPERIVLQLPLSYSLTTRVWPVGMTNEWPMWFDLMQSGGG